MARRAAEVYEPALGEQHHMATAGHRVAMDLRLDRHLFARRLVQVANVDLAVKMPDVTHDRVLRQAINVLAAHDILA